MEEKGATILTISDLIHRARTLTAALSLVPSSTLQPPKGYSSKSSSPIRQNPNLQTLNPLNHPALLIGIVTLPSSTNLASPIKCNCFQFSDGSAIICCDVLDYNANIIDQKIRILAWNFIPLKCGNRGVKGGFLEIIAWEFFHPCSENVCSLSGFSSFCLSLGACNFNYNLNASCLIFGVIESISPVCVVPCASAEGGSTTINGFLVNILVCECKSCASKYPVSELIDLCRKNVKRHSFIKSVIVYFCGLTASWHPVVLKFIGDFALLTGLKKKLVYIRKEESQLMYVTTDEASLHTKLFKEQVLNYNNGIRGKGQFGNYTGVITGSYMQGMVLELDQDIILLLTDQCLTVPHSVRVGSIVTLKNVHLVDPKFAWGKMLILGACCRTSVHVESFSPLESWCHLKSQSPSLLQKFINSLSPAARLWALLAVSCFRKKFAGILSDKEILGSKHKEGLAQKYASSHLPLSAFESRHGVLLEFCRHELCSGGKEVDCSHLRLVLLVANVFSYSDASWREVVDEQESSSVFTGGTIQKKPVWCSGRRYVQSTKRVLLSEEIGILVLGTLKISSSSGRLQLVDATGSVDIVLDRPASWDLERVFEVKDFKIIIEGVSPELVDLDSTKYQHLSCRNIFSNALPLVRLKTSIYLYHCPSDKNSGSHSPFFDWKGNSEDFDCGKYHLLMITHKFPIQQKFLGDRAKRSNIFAEAIVLPLYLVVAGKDQDEETSAVSSRHCKGFCKNFGRPKRCLTPKQSKGEQASAEIFNSSLNDAGNSVRSFCGGSCSSCSSPSRENTSCVLNNQLELPFFIAGKGVNSQWMGTLHSVDEHADFISDRKPPGRKILLEFNPDSFCNYESLKIGRCYLIKHREGHTKESQVSSAKVFITSGTYIRSFTLSSVEDLQNADTVEGFPFCNLNISNDELIHKEYWELGIPCLIGTRTGSEIFSDINIFVSSGSLNILENVIKKYVCILEKSRDSFAEESGIHDHGGYTIDASMQSSGSSCSDHSLPEGNLSTLRGLVLAFHDCDDVSFPALPCPVRGERLQLTFLQEQAGVCVHVLADNHIVRVFCNLSKESYPIGLGRDVYATFHRILVLSEPNKFMTTPVSFITIDHTSLISGNLTHGLNYASGTVGLNCVSSPYSVPTALISDALQSSELKPMQFRCRVVALYILVLEKSGNTTTSESCLHSIQSDFRIPLAGFIMDDGSATCCCWADSERAAAFLGLEEDYSLRRCKAGGKAKLNQVLEKHGRIIVKNYGPLFDSSRQDLTFCVDWKSLSRSDEDALGSSLVTNALFNTSWSVVGRAMDKKTLEERLSELDVAVPPLPNIRATSVSCVDVLSQARNIINGLIL